MIVNVFFSIETSVSNLLTLCSLQASLWMNECRCVTQRFAIETNNDTVQTQSMNSLSGCVSTELLSVHVQETT